MSGADDGDPAAAARSRWLPTSALTAAEAWAIHDLLSAAFPPGEDGFTPADWAHAIGGMHLVLELAGAIVAHASVVEREIRVGGRPVRTGYVEAVAVDPGWQGRGLGSRLMRLVATHIAQHFELGALGTGSHHFYERLGWRTWRGRSAVRIGELEVATPDEDGYILVLETAGPGRLDLDATISCPWRPGDVW